MAFASAPVGGGMHMPMMPPHAHSYQIQYKGLTVHHALRDGDLPLFHYLMSCGANAAEPDDQGRVPLHWACLYGHLELVAFLLQRGVVSIDVEDLHNRQTPLAWAAAGGHLEVVYYLTQLGANIHKADRFGFSPLMQAVQNGNLLVAHFLIACGADLYHVDTEGHDMVQWAAHNNRVQVMSYLHARGMDLLYKDPGRRTCVHWACKQDSREVLEYLIEVLPVEVFFDADNDGFLPVDSDVFRHLLADPDSVVHRYKDAIDQYAKSRSSIDHDRSGPTHSSSRHSRDVERTGGEIDWSKLRFAQIKHLHHTKGETQMMGFSAAKLLFMCVIMCGFVNPVVYWIIFFFGLYLLTRLARRTGEGRNMLFFSYMATYYIPVMITYLWWFGMRDFVSFLFVTCWVISWPNLIRTHMSDPGFIFAKPEHLREIFSCVERKIPINWKKVCRTCMMLRPLRSKHCSVRNCCIARFDHYCGWTVNAIGAGNHRTFLLFSIGLMSAFLLHMYKMVMYVYNHKLATEGLWEIAFQSHTAMFNYITAEIFLAGYLLILNVQQLMMVGRNLTVNEMMNAGRYMHLRDPTTGAFHNPFSLGFWGNMREFWLGPSPPLIYDGSVSIQGTIPMTQTAGGGCEHGCEHDHGGRGHAGHGHSHGHQHGHSHGHGGHHHHGGHSHGHHHGHGDHGGHGDGPPTVDVEEQQQLYQMLSRVPAMVASPGVSRVASAPPVSMHHHHHNHGGGGGSSSMGVMPTVPPTTHMGGKVQPRGTFARFKKSSASNGSSSSNGANGGAAGGSSHQLQQMDSLPAEVDPNCVALPA